MQDDFEQARSLFVEGVAHFEAQRLHAAERCFVDSLRKLPGRVSTRVNLAATWLRLGRASDALVELQAVLAQEPQHLDAWCHRAEALAELGRDAESLVCADHVLAADPRQRGCVGTAVAMLSSGCAATARRSRPSNAC